MSRNPLFAICLSIIVIGLSGCDPMDRNNLWTMPNLETQNNVQTANNVETLETSLPIVPENAKVSLLLPLTGRGSDVGQAMFNAAQLAMFDLKANELFELLPQDTGKGADVAASNAVKNNSNLIIGPLFSEDTKIVTPIALQKGINVVSFSTDVSATMGASFIMGFLPQTQVEQIMAYAAGQNIKSIALIAPRDNYGNSVASTFYASSMRYGVNNAGIIRYDSKIGLNPELLKSQIGTAQAVLIAASGVEAAKVSALLTSQGYPQSRLKRLGTGLWDAPEIAKMPELQGAWYAASSSNLHDKFIKRYVETYGVKPPRLASLAYDATALAVVLAKSGKGFGRDALTGINGFIGVDGIFRFNTDGIVERGTAIIEISGGAVRIIREAPATFSSF